MGFGDGSVVKMVSWVGFVMVKISEDNCEDEG